MITIGIRELRQRASEYVRRVDAGERVQITSRGRPVALLVPIPAGDAVARLEAEGRLTEPGEDLLAIGSPPKGKAGAPAPSQRLREARRGER